MLARFSRDCGRPVLAISSPVRARPTRSAPHRTCVGPHRTGDQPRVRARADGNEAGVHESVLGQRAESGRDHVGVRAILQVVNQVQQYERVPFLAADLEIPSTGSRFFDAIRRELHAPATRMVRDEPYSLGNGDGRRPKPGTSGCSRPDTVALSLIAARQTDVGCLRYVAPYLPSASVGKTPYHLDSHLILKSRVEIKTERSLWPGAPLRNRTVGLLLTMDIRSAGSQQQPER
jgi:hypothetical protein